MVGKQKLVGLFIEEIDQQQVAGVFGKMPEGVSTNISRLSIIEGSDLVGDVHNPKLRVDAHQLSFHCSCQVILRAEIGSDGENGRHSLDGVGWLCKLRLIW